MIEIRSRRRFVTIATLALVVGYGSNWGQMLLRPFTNRQATLETMQQELDRQTAALGMQAEQARKLKSWTQMALPFEEAAAAALYYPYLSKLAEQTGLRQVTITPVAAELAAPNARWWSLSISAEASVDEWADFFYRFHATPLLQRIARWELLPASESLLRGSLVIDAACLRGAHASVDDIPQPLGNASSSLFAARDWFSDRRVTYIPDLPEESVQLVEAIEPVVVEQPPRPPLKLVGTLLRNNRNEAWFYEPQSGRQIVVREEDQLELSANLGQVASVDAQGVNLIVQGARVRIEIGSFSP